MPHKIKTVVEATTGTGAAGVVIVDPNIYYDVLTHTGVFGMVYADWFKVFAAAYVVMLSIKMLWSFGKWICKKVRNIKLGYNSL